MAYVFARTKGDARKHLFARYGPRADRPFTSSQQMFDYLAGIYINPHQIRDAEVKYNELRMKYCDSFHDFKTQFLHLADEARIPTASRFYGLYDRLPTNLQAPLAAQLMSYGQDFDKLAEAASHLDSELKRINQRKSKESTERKKSASVPIATAARVPSAPTPPVAQRPANVSPTTPRFGATPAIKTEKSDTPPLPVICFNCNKPGHKSFDCTEPRRHDLKEIEEESDGEGESGNDDA